MPGQSFRRQSIILQPYFLAGKQRAATPLENQTKEDKKGDCWCVGRGLLKLVRYLGLKRARAALCNRYVSRTGLQGLLCAGGCGQRRGARDETGRRRRQSIPVRSPARHLDFRTWQTRLRLLNSITPPRRFSANGRASGFSCGMARPDSFLAGRDRVGVSCFFNFLSRLYRRFSV